MAIDPLAHPLRTAVERALDRRVEQMSVVRGGDVAAAFRLELVGGGVVFAKTHPSPPPGFFTTEATGLSWLREANAVRVPDVLAVSDGPDGSNGSDDPDESPPFLALGWIDEGRPAASTDAELGAALAALHDAGAPSFGREDRRTTGSRGLPNDPHPTWAGFYAECRLLPLARLAAASDALPTSAIRRLERLASTLDRFDDGAPASRLHGDLWGGNRLVDRSGQSWLIDPAAHGGHREFDLAMMRLFGGFSAGCFLAYEERHPLAPGWEDRVPLHQIAPLVVHAIKFGGGYVPAAVGAITRYS
ncbi:MAG TPA: fructosamine kinase family protein [Ilumatobacteraceae bacterium]